MKYKSRAIALTYIKHGESSIISRLFTEEKGLQSFIIKGARSKKSKRKLSYFEPLTALNINGVFSEKKSLQYLEDISIYKSSRLTNGLVKRNFIAFFIAEINSRVLQENDQNKALFDFLWKTTEYLFLAERIDKNFPLKYLLELSAYLGFYPSTIELNKPFFNLENGCFVEKNDSNLTLGGQKSTYLKALINKKKLSLTQDERSALLRVLFLYYKLQHYNLDGITSHLIIESLRK